ncbi:putative uncharacterized protein [Blautia hydrogenotrophica CAG:147]|nr:putative uncharacterized protein [Blautia hydrogenotrophica CAG:147]
MRLPTVRDTYMSDYELTEQEVKSLLERCRAAGTREQDIILKAAQIANDSISIPILINLTSGIGYDRLSMWYEIPMQRKDFQGYRRKALKVLNDLIKLHEVTDLRLKK